MQVNGHVLAPVLDAALDVEDPPGVEGVDDADDAVLVDALLGGVAEETTGLADITG